MNLILQSVWISLGVVTWLVFAAFLGWADIGPAILGHEGIMVVVVLNAFRLLGFQEREPT